MPATTILANAVLNLMFGGTAWATKPSTLYFALFTSNPNISGGGVEVSGTGYARAAMTANSTNFTDPATAGENSILSTALAWPRATDAWGSITGYGIYDAATGGNLLWFEAFSSAIAVGTGQQMTLGGGTITFSFGGVFGNTLEQKFLKHFLRGEAWVAVGTHYFGLGVNVTEAGLSSEAASNGYARVAMANNKTTYGSAASGVLANSAVIAFPNATGSWSGSPLTAWAIYDALTAGNCLWSGALANSVSISSGVYQFASGELKVGLIG